MAEVSRGVAIALIVIGTVLVIASPPIWMLLNMYGCGMGATSADACRGVWWRSLFTRDALNWFWPPFGLCLALLICGVARLHRP